jgi:hypothetical protein
MKPCARALLVFLLLLTVLAPLPAAAQAPDRLVLAFYYNWFDENSWKSGVPDVPTAPYVSRDRGVMGRHIDQAKGAGIDALLVNWYGPRVENNQTETNLRVLLDEAGGKGFRIGVDVDLASPFLPNSGTVQEAIGALLNTHAKHGAYLRSGGKPVIFFYHSSRYGVGTWQAIRQAVDPNHNSIWIEEGVDVSGLTVFDGHHLYSNTWANRTDPAYTSTKFAKLVRQQSAALGAPKVYVATVMPGYDDTHAGRGGAGFAVPRENGAWYERTWQAAIDCQPDWVVITSFNEFPEGSFIEPSQGTGNRYLELTAKWAAMFHSATPPQPTPTSAPTATPLQPSPTAAPTATSEPTHTVEPTVTSLATVTPAASVVVSATLTDGLTPAPTATPAPSVFHAEPSYRRSPMGDLRWGGFFVDQGGETEPERNSND